MTLFTDLTKFQKIVRNRRLEKATKRQSAQNFIDFFSKWNRGDGKWPILVEFDQQKHVFRISDQDNSSYVHVSRSSRVPLYAKGVGARLEFLWREYLAHHVPIEEGDIVIDIGANVGEFSMAARGYGARTVSIEPDPTEFRSLTANLADQQCLNIALWNERKTMTFYSKNSTGDSSLIEMSDYAEKIEVQAMTLDEVSDDVAPGKPIKLIKLEAEGAEPEIIQGAQNVLQRTRYIAVDAGPERGLEQENTVVPVLNALSALGFELIAFGNYRHVMLLKRKDA